MKNVFDFLRRKKETKVVEIFLQNDYYHVKLSHGSYEMIYRAARGVCWDPETSSLYFKGVTSREKALSIIAEAMREEYGINLKF